MDSRLTEELAERVLKGDEMSAARLISLVEAGNQAAYRELTKLLPHTGHAHVIGVTGPAGSGKSTIIGKVALRMCEEGKGLGIIAIDPTSMRSRGALLGDRVRMKEAESTGQVFIRSMADRDHPGGVCRASMGAVYVMEGLGKECIIIESVGAGQSDKALFQICDTVVTVFTPEFGDEIQLLKAGLLEIGDIVVINKGDKGGTEDVRCAISAHVEKGAEGDWSIPILITEAHLGKGVDELMNAIKSRWDFLREGGREKAARKEKVTSFMLALLKEEIWRRFIDTCSGETAFEQITEGVRSGAIDPYSAVEIIAERIEARIRENVHSFVRNDGK
ncbi:MAG: methylmalonyl Co-A mutase-associated GTPase MeaB [Pseudomonadota bacterium]